ncbi:MAG TPA: GspE/PulE family protein [Candidatus Saccharimonadia bacterium]|jgi:type II secretory ATPase GspE/PulE/Tfp pilus assembly ATPase PilB-like protein
MTDSERDQIEQSAQMFATQLGVDYFDTRPRIDITKMVGKLTIMGMQAYGVVPVALSGYSLTLATSEETDRNQLESLRARLAGYEVKFVFVSQFGWNRLFNRYAISQNQDVLETGDFNSFNQRILNIEPKFMFEPVAQLAYQLGASDIHVEPAERDARIRFRIDGTLHPITTIPKDRYDLFASDLQMRAGVKWGGDEPQGGRVSLTVINDDGDEVQLNMRLETIPSLHGEDVVVRLFNLSVQYLNLENLKLSDRQLKTLLRCVSHPRGLVMCVGPTGSGKTSMLYSVMNHLNNPEVKIVTLEDPIEYELEGISQIPVRSDNQQLFMDKLRAVMREDPNIVMIGEIRDADTAKTALQASLTGHLVLSTFHANNASAAISRLMDMIGQNPLLASSIKLIMAQRLVRQLCPVCKTTYTPSKSDLLQIKTAVKGLPTGSYPSLDNLRIGKPVGCKACHHFGYQGRISILEQFEVTPKMEELISTGTAATTAIAIEEAAIKDGMVTLLQDGMLKVLELKTTLEEVLTQVGE